MRHDILQDRKCVHVKLDKDVHAGLRAKLFKHGLSMQEVFEEFAKQFVTDESKAVRIVEGLTMRKLREAIDGKPKRQRKRNQRVNELDHDALYSMISQDEKDGTPPSKPGGHDEAA